MPAVLFLLNRRDWIIGQREVLAITKEERRMKKWRRIEITALRQRTTIILHGALTAPNQSVTPPSKRRDDHECIQENSENAGSCRVDVRVLSASTINIGAVDEGPLRTTRKHRANGDDTVSEE